MEHIDDFELTDEQIKAVKSVELALKKARKSGLYILAKQESLNFYKGEVYERGLNNPLHKYWDDGRVIPHETIFSCINDSGTDETEHFPTDMFDDEGYLIKPKQ